MHLNIYFNTNKLQISDNFSKLPTHEKEILDIISEDFISLLIDSSNQTFIHYTTDVPKTFEKFKKSFEYIIACGGLVLNQKDELLMIYRNGVWDLAKGKLDEGETFEACAVREVVEETGLTDCKIKAYACSCYHLYLQKNKRILKETKWFWMQSNHNQVFIPQIEEKIERVEWVRTEKAIKRLHKSYRSFEEIIPLL